MLRGKKGPGGKKGAAPAAAAAGKPKQKQQQQHSLESLLCKLCDVQCATIDQFEAHCQGKKHRKRASDKEAAEIAAAERDVQRALEDDIMSGPPDFQGWLLKRRKHDEEGVPCFDRRYFELRGSYLVYKAGPSAGLPSKGVLSLSGVSIHRWAPQAAPPAQCHQEPEVPEAAQEEDDSSPPTPPGMTPTSRPADSRQSGTAPEMPPALELSSDGRHAAEVLATYAKGQGPNAASVGPTGKDLGLVLCGGDLGRELFLKMESGVELDSWESHIRGAVEKAEDADREVERSQLAAEVHCGGSCVYQRGGVYRPPHLVDFDLLTVIGRGSFGKVLKVQSKVDGRTYAMKVITKEAVLREDIADKVRGERASLADTDHPFVAVLHFAFQTAQKLFLIMPFYAGGDLRFHLRSRQNLKEPAVAFYGAQMALALEHLHSRSILYRDLKPANVVLGYDGYAVLTDFGMAKHTPGLRAKSFCGTDAYVAPEMVREQEYDQRVDWWSLGVVLYELAVGRAPFWDESPSVIYDLITDQKPYFPGFLSKDITAVVTGLLQKLPADRLSAAEDVLKSPFFARIDRDLLCAKKLSPPIIPNTEKSDTRYFDAVYTRERAELSMCRAIPGKHEDLFADFTYPRLSVS